MKTNTRTQPWNLAHNRQPRRRNPRSFAFWQRLCLCWFLSLTMGSLPAMPPAVRAEVRPAPAANPAAPAPAPAAAPQSNVDLTITALDTAALVTDSQTLILSGMLGATVKNLGSAATNAQFRVIAFEDRNANGQFNAATDAMLGSTNVTDSIAAGANANLSLTLGGSVTFKGNLIYVFVDSENAIAETNENNNIWSTRQNLPDLTASLIRNNPAAYPASTELTARIGNGGGSFVPSVVKVSFYRGDPAAGGTLIGTTQTTISLNPGQYEDAKLVWNNPPIGLHQITVVADDAGNGQGMVSESDETNNKAVANVLIGPGPFLLVDNLIARFKDSVVDLRWSPIAGAASYNIYRRTGNNALQLLKRAHARANYADSGLTNGTIYYYTVRWVNASGIESGDGTEMSATPTSQNNRSDVPPTIISAPVTRFFANTTYSYQVRALDPNPSDTLSYALPTPALASLNGIAINANTGSIQWTTNYLQAGYHDVPVRVIDSRGRFATQTYRLFVEIPNSPPLVNAGPDQTLQLTAQLNPVTTPTPTPNPNGTIQLIPISTAFNNPIGIDYHPTSNKIVMSVNWNRGQPYNFELVAADGSRTRFSDVADLSDELKIATVRSTANGFTMGELFTGSGAPGVIVRISPDGSSVQNPWVTLPGEGGLLRGSLYVDKTGVFGGDLIVVTTAGGVWRVKSTGQATRLASLGTHLEGVSTIPNDVARYGPWAGKILIGAEGQGRLYTVDAAGNSSFFEIGISPEDIDIIPPNENFFGVNFGAGRLMGAASSQFASMVGDLLISQESGALYRVRWNGTAFEKTLLATVAQWEHMTFAPVGLVEIPPPPPLGIASTTLAGSVLDDGLPFGSTVTSTWTKVSGPGTVNFANPNLPVTTASFSAVGTYVLRLTGNDSALTSFDDVTITVASHRIYTLNADFDTGNLNNVEHRIPHQLQLGNQAAPFNFIWVAVSSKGTAVKINTETGQILGEYSTSPDGQPKNPSRTTVDLNGNVWMTNRDGNSVTRVGLVENGQCIDRNGNGRIDTSTGQNNIKAWTNAGGADTNGGVTTAQDECVINYVRVSSSGTRHVSVDQNNDVWVSGTGNRIFNLIDGKTGVIKRTEGPVGYGGYGGLIDRNGVIWSSTLSSLLRWDISKPLSGPNGVNWRGYDEGGYGLAIDGQGSVWNTNHTDNLVRKYSSDGTLLGRFVHNGSIAQGCAADKNGHVWIAHGLNVSNTVAHMKNDGTWIGNVTVGLGPTGVAVDAAGKIWATSFDSRTVSRINPNAGPIGADGVTRVGEVDFTTVDLGGNPYNYSDMTGSTLTSAGNVGTWTVIFDSTIANAEWGRIGWSAQVCGDGALTVTAASSNDNTTFSAAQNVTRGQDLTVPNGRYLRISVLFRRATTGESPILYDLSVGTEGYTLPALANTPPTVDAGADLTTALFIPVKLKGSACDDGLPNGTLSFTWTKVSGPGTVTFANANALATTATINTPGAYVLRLTANDGQSTVSDELNVTIDGTNSPPVITSVAPTSTCSTRPYSYQVIANDPNFGDVLTYSLPIAPTGMTINSATGLIQWTPGAAQTGSNNVKVRVTDLGNNQVEQSFTINVAATPATNTAPSISSTAPTSTAVGLLYSYQVAANDPDPCETRTYSLDVAPAGMTIGATGLIQWTPTAAQQGNNNVTVRVRDFAGLFATQSFVINVAPPDNTPPVVAIASPAAGATLSADVPIVGSINDNFLQSWTLEYQVMGGSNWVTLATGTTPVNNATLATFPATLLANNSYILRLRASDFTNQVETFREVIVNSGELKLGAFTLAYEDLRLPGVGVPISIRRFYDSRRVEAGDFGPGWTLGFSNVDIRTDASQNVFITLPNGRRTAFAFVPQLIGFFPVYANRYVAPAGVYDTLENTDSPFLFRSSGQWFDLDFSPYNPQNYVLKTKEGLTFTLSATGGIRKIEDRNGRFIEITSNGVTSSTGRNVVFTRNAAGRITQIKDPSNNLLKYEYDAAGRLVRFTDQLNLATSYVYQGATSFLTEVRTPGNCRPLKTEYGPDGRVTAKEDNAGNRSTYSYDQANRTEAITNPLGKTAVYKYDARGNLLEVRDPLGTVTTYIYDANNNVISAIFPSGRKIEQTFDSSGNVLTRTKRAPGGATLTDAYTYTTSNQIASVTKPQGEKAVFQYDNKGNLTRQERRDAADNPIQAESYTYDSRGNLLTRTDGAGKVTSYTYNNFGEATRQQDATGVATNFEYDANGNINARIDGAGNRMDYEYDGFNLLAKVKHGGQAITSTTYNELGKPLTITDALGHATTLGYDCQGNLTQVTDAAGKITRYQVDALSSLKKVTDAKNHESNYQYDAMNRQTARTGPDGGENGLSYETDGYTQTETTPNGATIQMQYDGFGRLQKEIRPEKTIEYAYADCCRATQIEEKIGAVTRRTTLSYDGIGRIIGTTDPQNRTVSYTYNARGQRASMATPDGLATNYSYDDAGRLTEVRTGTDWVRFTYDAAGRRGQSLYSNGASNTYTYNSRGLLASVVIRNAANAVIASYGYTRNANGQVTGTAYQDGSANYTLDALNRLTGETVASASLGNFNRTFGYDEVGNRQDAGATFGPDNRLLGDAGGAYAYDANGNLITRGAKSFGYDSRNHLLSFTGSGTSASYEYDYLNHRVAKTVNGVRREFLYDGPKLAVEYLGGAQVARYSYGIGIDEALMVVRGGQTYFYHADGLGSIVAITNGSGQAVQRYGYDAFGNLRLNSGSFAFSGVGLVNTLTFTGREYDAESGLYHYRARAYDAAIGRFLQKDRQQGNLADPQSQHLYAYALNNPVNFKDPTGETVFVEYSFILDGPQNQLAAAIIGFALGVGLPGLIFLGEFLGLADSHLDTRSIWDEALNRTEKKLQGIYDQLGIAEKIGECASNFIEGFPSSIPAAFNSGVEWKVGLKIEIEIDLGLGDFANSVAGCLLTFANVDTEHDVLIIDSIEGGGLQAGAAVGLTQLRLLRPK